MTSIPGKSSAAPLAVGLICLLICILLLGTTIAWAVNLRRIVEFVPQTPVAVQQDIVEASGSRLLRVLPIINAVVIKLPAAHTERALAYLRSRPEVKEIHVDAAVNAQGISRAEGIEGSLITSAAPPQEYPWNLRQIQLDQVDPSVRGQGVQIAVIDTGIDASHPSLAGVVIDGYNAVTEESAGAEATGLSAAGEGPDGEGPDGEGPDGEGPDGEGPDARVSGYGDCNGHGTHIAGIIASHTVGIAPEATLHAVRVLGCDGNGFVADLISGLNWVLEHPEIWLANMSLGFYRSDRALYPLFHKAIKKLNGAGVVMVASAGNLRPDCINPELQEISNSPTASGEGPDRSNGPGTTHAPQSDQEGCNTRVKFPARYQETLSVAAATEEGQIAYYSMHGPEVVVTAPGGTHVSPIVSTAAAQLSDTRESAVASGLTAAGEGPDGEGPDGEGAYGHGSGTSQAAAHVTGVVALMLSVNPGLTLEAIRSIFEDTSYLVDAPMSAQGVGLINAPGAVEAAKTWVGETATARYGRTRISRKANIAPGASVGDGTRISRHVVIEEGARVGVGTRISKNVMIEGGASVGDETKVSKNVVIEQDVTVGDGARISKNVVLSQSTSVGNQVIVGRNTEVGAEGQMMDGSATQKDVTLGEFSTIGYNSRVHRGAIIGNGVALGHGVVTKENVQIGELGQPNLYGTSIGDYTIIHDGVRIGQNADIGAFVTIGKDAVICDRAVIPDHTEIPAYTRVGCN